MFGHGCFPGAPAGGAPDFCPGAGVVELDVDGVADCVVVVALVVLLGAAAAPAIPATAPVVASAPATIVAPSILEMVMRVDLLGRLTASASNPRTSP